MFGASIMLSVFKVKRCIGCQTLYVYVIIIYKLLKIRILELEPVYIL